MIMMMMINQLAQLSEQPELELIGGSILEWRCHYPAFLLARVFILAPCPFPADSEELPENVFFHTQLMDVTCRGPKHRFIKSSVSVLQPWPHWLSTPVLIAPSLRNPSSVWRTAWEFRPEWVLAPRPSRPSAVQKRDSRCWFLWVL